jgi:hypothetical protein
MPLVDSPQPLHSRPGIVPVTWALASLIAAYLLENLWLDDWLHARFAALPSLLPAPLTPFWFAVFALGGLSCVVLLVCAVLIARHRHISPRAKMFTAAAVVAVCALWGLWFSATRETTAAATLQNQKHSVKLKWNPSSSANVQYNVYRSTVSGRDYVKLNTTPIKDLVYTDETVESGKTYYYVTRSVDAKGRESSNSAEAIAAVP